MAYQLSTEIVKLIEIAAITAPKAKGINNIRTRVLDSEEVILLLQRMTELGEANNHAGFLRDSKNCASADGLILIGAQLNRAGLKLCGWCGYANCAENEQHQGKCVYNLIDLGIAVGSAVSRAMDLRIDNRVMYSIGYAALDLKIMGAEVNWIIGVPLSVSGKNIFFDR